MSGNYGIRFSVDGKAVQETRAIEKGLQNMGRTAVRETGAVEGAIKHLGEEFNTLQHRIVEAFAVERLIEFGKEVMHVTAEFEGFENRIKFASLNTIDAAQNMGFLRDQVNSLHLPMRQVYEGFSEMEAGLRGTGIEGQKLRDLFEGISTASATLHLPEYQLQRTLYDLKEIGEIGLNARIERSLGTALPGINGIVQQAFGGKTMKELQQAGISGGEFLSKLGPALKKNFESGLESYSESLQAKMADTSNKFLQTQIELGEKLKPVYISIMSGLASGMENVGKLVNYLGEHKEQVEEVVHAVEALVIAMVAYKVVTLGVAAAEGIQTIAMGLMTAASFTAEFGIEGLIVALDSLNVAFGATGIGVFATALGVIIQQFIMLNGEVDEALEKMSHLKGADVATDLSMQHWNDVQQELKDPNLNKIKRGEMMEQIGKYKTEDEGRIKTLSHQLEIDRQGLKDWTKTRSHGKTEDFNKLSPYLQNQGKDLKGNLDKVAEDLARITGNVSNYSSIERQFKKYGYTKPTYKMLDPTGGAAMHSSHLSGASGGLGQAKVINIKIDRVMTVENHDNRNLEKHAEQAAQYVIRAANNFAESQSGTY